MARRPWPGVRGQVSMARLSTDVRHITTEQERRAATYGYTSVLHEGAV